MFWLEYLPHLLLLCFSSLLTSLGLILEYWIPAILICVLHGFKTHSVPCASALHSAPLSAAVTATAVASSAMPSRHLHWTQQTWTPWTIRAEAQVKLRFRVAAQKEKLKWKAKCIKHDSWHFFFFFFFPPPSDEIAATSCVEQLLINDEAPLINMHVVLTVQLDCPKTWKLPAERSGAC